MKKCISASSALFVTAMMVTLSFGCGEGTDGDTGYAGLTQSMETTDGTCNAIVARSLGTAQHCIEFGCSESECIELSDTFVEFFTTPGCAGALTDGELNGLPGNASTQPGGPNAGDPKHIAEVICGAIEACGEEFCDNSQAAGICITTDACNP
jgi:hypothetical protein